MWQIGLSTIGLLVVANIFMTFAWYGHLKLQQLGHSSNWPLVGIILFSWIIALAEYAFQVPANRMGFIGNGGPFTLMQLKVMQEVITLVVFTVVANFMFQGNELRWNHLVAFFLLIGAVYFVFLDTSK
ncbi:MAG: DMT family protein [Rikenellaceae bacterium]